MIVKYKILLVVISTLLFLSCSEHSENILFHYVDSLEKVLPEQTLFMDIPAEVDVVRGETATFQFAIRANDELRDVKVGLRNVRSLDTGKNTTFDGTKVSFVGKVHVGRAQAEPGSDIIHSASNYYPDPLMDDESIDVPAAVTTSAWISIPIDKDIDSGKYEGEVFFEGVCGREQVNRSITISINVYSTILNKQTLKVTNWYQPGFGYVDGEDVPQFSERWWNLMEEMGNYMKEYRQNVVKIDPLRLADYTFEEGKVVKVDFARFDDVVKFFKQKGILNMIAGGHIAGREGGWTSQFGYFMPVLQNNGTAFKWVDCENSEAKEFYKLFFKELLEHLKQQDWLGMYIQHIADEPIKSNAKSYISISSYVKELAPGLLIVDACHTKDLDNQIDVWIPQLNYLHRDYEFYKSQQEKGKIVWFYTCVWPQGEYANRYIQQPLIKTRLLHWINYKYGIDGYLHWGLNFWRGDDPMVETAAIQPDGLVLPAGDAWVLYPYKRHLIPSIRLEAMRDGIVDYELLKLLELKNPQLATQLTNSLVYDFDKYDIDIVHFRKIRRQLLEALED